MALFAGAHIGFAGAIWTTGPHIEILAPMLPLCYHLTDHAMRRRAARYFGATKKAILKLKEYYSGPKSDWPIRTFPFPAEYTALDGSGVQPFTYVSQLFSEKLLFHGLATGNAICIKFTRHYSKEAHLACASLGFAPRLRGFEILPGGWFMVVMDLLGDYYHTLIDIGIMDRGLFCQELETKIGELHRRGFVHGDIRPTNVMVKKSGESGIMLLDFDWAGAIGEARYPMNVNTTDIRRPVGVVDDALILAAHDLEMVYILPTNV
jgi:serine/threonine protein kinase